MKYSKEEVEFIELQIETILSDIQVARNFIAAFDSDRDIDAVRGKSKSVRNNLKAKGKTRQIKRLFFDIETSQLLVKLWRVGKNNWVNAERIVRDRKIICISYKWQFENTVHTLVWDKNMNDRKLIKDFIKILGEADEIIGHNGDRFDIKEIRTRAIQEGLLMFPNYRSFDTLKKARKYFNFNSNKLNYLGKIFEVGRKLDHEGIGLWDKVEDGNKKALKTMASYCEQDVLLLEDVFHFMSPYVDHNTNYAVLLNKEKYNCPHCASDKIEFHHKDTTPKGWIHRWMKCNGCKKQYKISNKSYMKFLTDRHEKRK